MIGDRMGHRHRRGDRGRSRDHSQVDGRDAVSARRERYSYRPSRIVDSVAELIAELEGDNAAA